MTDPMGLHGADPLPRSGEGFVLRRLAVADLPAFQAYRSDAELGRYQGWRPMQDADAIAFLAEMHAAPFPRRGDWNQIAIARPGDQCLIGDIGICVAEDGQHAEIGFTLARAAQGRGIATSAVREAIALAFSAGGVARVMAVTDARNAASIRLLERLGMLRVDTREAVFRGEPCLEHTYATP
jgi:ribosomal-protein-alanine N-acetyltransferase